MSNELTFGIRLDGSASTFVSAAKAARDEMVNLKSGIDDLSTASKKMAAGTSSEFAEIQRRLNEWAIAEDNARDKAWALAHGYQEVGGQIVKVNSQVDQSMGKSSHASAGVTRELIVMGHEAVSGNFSRIPGTMMVLAERSGFALSALASMNPVVLGLAAAAAAGAVAWFEWGKSAEEAANRASESAKAAAGNAKSAWSGVHLSTDEQIDELQNKMSGVWGQLESALAKRNAVTGSTSSRDAQNIGAEVLARRSELEAYQRQMDELQAKREKQTEDSNAKLLADTKRFDEEMLTAHEDAFSKEISLWKKKEEDLSAAGLYGGAVRKQHEAAYTQFVLDENAKRDAAALKEKAAKEKHLAEEQIQQAAYYGRIAAMSENYGTTAQSRAALRYNRELIDLERNHKQMAIKVAADHDAALAEEAAYQQARLNLKKAYDAQFFYAQVDLAEAITAFNAGNREKEITGTLGYLKALTALNAANNKDSFEANKFFAIASATVNTYLAATEAFAKAGGGYSGAIAAAASIAYGLAQVAAIESTKYGGGGIPSMATSPGLPVSQQPSPTGTALPTNGVAAAPIRQVNLHLHGQFLDMDTVRKELIPMLNEAAGDGVIINVGN